MSSWVLDTNVLIAYSREQVSAVAWLESHVEHCSLSAVTVAEFMQGVRNEKERRALDWYCACMPVLPVTQDIAIQAGQWGQQYGKSHQLEMADVLIAATAHVHSLKLATHNLKHYPMFKGLKAPY